MRLPARWSKGVGLPWPVSVLCLVQAKSPELSSGDASGSGRHSRAHGTVRPYQRCDHPRSGHGFSIVVQLPFAAKGVRGMSLGRPCESGCRLALIGFT